MPKEWHRLEETGVDGRKMLYSVLNKQEGRCGQWLIFVNMSRAIRFHKREDISWLRGKLLVFQRLCLMHDASKLGIYENVWIMTALLMISYNNKHIWIPLLSVTIFEVTKLKTLIYNLAIAALLCKQLHILRGCPTKQRNQIVLMHDVRLVRWWCAEVFALLGLLGPDDGTDRLFLNIGN